MANIQLVVEVAGESPGAPGVSREFLYAKVYPTPPLVTLSLADNAGITEYEWRLLDQPLGASAVLSSTEVASPTLTPTVGIPGTYFFECISNGGTSYARIALAFDTENQEIRIPAAGETSQYGMDKGWAAAMRKLIATVDSGSGQSPWSVTGGTSSVKRAANGVGTVEGDYAINAGWGGDAGADYSFQGGRDNVITDASSQSVAFGGGPSGSSLHNVIGAVVQSPQSFVIGENNSVDGDSFSQLGFNAAFGKDLDVDGDFSFVHGRSINFSGGYSAVFGRDNDVGQTEINPFGIVTGRFNTVNGFDDKGDVFGGNAVFGLANSVAASACVVGGEQNTISVDFETKHTAVFGTFNDIGANLNTDLCLVAGASNTVDGNSNAVFGATNTVYGSNNIVGGSLNEAYTSWSLICGNEIGVSDLYCAVFGVNVFCGDDYQTPYSLVMGRDLSVDGAGVSPTGYNLVCGFDITVEADYSAVSGESHEVLSNHSGTFGDHHLTYGAYSGVFGGYNEASSDYSFVTGYGSKSKWYGQIVHSGYTPDTNYRGSLQNTVEMSLSMSVATSPATWEQLWPDGDGGSEVLALDANMSYYHHFKVVARTKSQGMMKTWYGRVAAVRNTGSASLVGTPVVNADFATSVGDEASWDFRVTVASNALVFEGMGSADASNPTFFQLQFSGPEIFEGPVV